MLESYKETRDMNRKQGRVEEDNREECDENIRSKIRGKS